MSSSRSSRTPAAPPAAASPPGDAPVIAPLGAPPRPPRSAPPAHPDRRAPSVQRAARRGGLLLSANPAAQLASAFGFPRAPPGGPSTRGFSWADAVSSGGGSSITSADDAPEPSSAARAAFPGQFPRRSAFPGPTLASGRPDMRNAANKAWAAANPEAAAAAGIASGRLSAAADGDDDLSDSPSGSSDSYVPAREHPAHGLPRRGAAAAAPSAIPAAAASQLASLKADHPAFGAAAALGLASGRLPLSVLLALDVPRVLSLLESPALATAVAFALPPAAAELILRVIERSGPGAAAILANPHLIDDLLASALAPLASPPAAPSSRHRSRALSPASSRSSSADSAADHGAHRSRGLGSHRHRRTDVPLAVATFAVRGSTAFPSLSSTSASSVPGAAAAILSDPLRAASFALCSALLGDTGQFSYALFTMGAPAGSSSSSDHVVAAILASPGAQLSYNNFLALVTGHLPESPAGVDAAIAAVVALAPRAHDTLRLALSHHACATAPSPASTATFAGGLAVAARLAIATPAIVASLSATPTPLFGVPSSCAADTSGVLADALADYLAILLQFDSLDAMRTVASALLRTFASFRASIASAAALGPVQGIASCMAWTAPPRCPLLDVCALDARAHAPAAQPQPQRQQVDRQPRAKAPAAAPVPQGGGGGAGQTLPPTWPECVGVAHSMRLSDPSFWLSPAPAPLTGKCLKCATGVPCHSDDRSTYFHAFTGLASAYLTPLFLSRAIAALKAAGMSDSHSFRLLSGVCSY